MTAGRSAQNMAARKRAKAAVLREQADRLDRDADRWELGDLGERLVGGRLELLRPDGWYVLHDVRWPGRVRANLDHVVVGPPGVMVVDAKNWSGSVSVQGGRLRQNGHPRDREAQAVADAADAVAGLLSAAAPVHPVLCLAAGPSTRAQTSGRTTVLSVDELVDWARALPPALSTDELLRLAAQLRQALPAAGVARRAAGQVSRARRKGPAAVTRSAAARPRRRHAASRRTSHRRAVLLRVAVGIAALLALPWSLQQLAGTIAAGRPSAAPTQPVAAPQVVAPVRYPGCTALRAVYPNGVKAKGAANAGHRARPVSAVDTALATANGRLDDDGDGLVCERLRGRQGSAKH